VAATRKPYPPVVQAIMDGEHDENLDLIASACRARLKNRFRKRQIVRLRGTRNPELEGKTGVVLSVNQKTINVGIGQATTDEFGTTYAGGTFRVPPAMLEPVQ
jgi:hypothetical protein